MTQHILVVDDDPSVNALVAAVLREEGFEVEAAINGRDALERLKGTCPDAVILDLQMPVMDGRTFYTHLRTAPCATPVLIVSAHGARQAQRELGAEAALDKPFDLDELAAQVRRLVGSA